MRHDVMPHARRLVTIWRGDTHAVQSLVGRTAIGTVTKTRPVRGPWCARGVAASGENSLASGHASRRALEGIGGDHREALGGSFSLRGNRDDPARVEWRDCSGAGRPCQRRPGDPYARGRAGLAHMQAPPALLSRPLHEHGVAQHTVSVQPLAAPAYLADSSGSLLDAVDRPPLDITSVVRRLTRVGALNVPEHDRSAELPSFFARARAPSIAPLPIPRCYRIRSSTSSGQWSES
jgi:hypothetical protein